MSFENYINKNEHEALDLTGHIRTVSLLKYILVFVGFAAGGWSIYFLFIENFVPAIFEAITTALVIIAYIFLHAGFTNTATHLTIWIVYLFVIFATFTLEGIGQHPFTVNHLFLIPSIPGAFMLCYKSSITVKYSYAILFFFTFVIIEYNIFNLSFVSMTSPETLSFSRSFAIILCTLIITYLFYSFFQQINKTELALVDTNNKLESVVEKLLPKKISEKLRNNVLYDLDTYSECTILSSDIVGFTPLTMTLPPEDLLNLLNDIFSKFDQICEKHGLEKIKTIGDAYIMAGGIPDPMPNHAIAVTTSALEFLEVIQEFDMLDIRIGIHSGEVNGGILGKKRFIYDIWGKAVTISSTMESEGISGKIHVSHDTYLLLKNNFKLTEHEEIKTKWGQKIKTYLLDESLPPKRTDS